MSNRAFSPARRPAIAAVLAVAVLGLSQAACSSLSRPDEIAIQAEPVRPPKKEAPAAAQPAAPVPAPAPAAAGG